MTYTFKRITADRYDAMIGMLPPAQQRHGAFLMGEEWDHSDGEPCYRAFFHLPDDRFVECEQPVSRFTFDRVLSNARVARMLNEQEAAAAAMFKPEPWWDREDATSFEGEVWRSAKRLISITFNPPAARHDDLRCVVVNGHLNDTTHSILKVY